MDRAINERTIHLKELTDQYKSKVKLISELKGQISLTDAIEQKVTLDQEIQILEEKLKQYEGKIYIFISCPFLTLKFENLLQN